MKQGTDKLRARRAALLQRVEMERQDLRGHLKHIGTTLDGVDRGLRLVRRVATPPVLLAGGVLAALLLGRGRSNRVLAAGMALLGVVLRIRSVDRTLANLARWQSSPD